MENVPERLIIVVYRRKHDDTEGKHGEIEKNKLNGVLYPRGTHKHERPAWALLYERIDCVYDLSEG